MAPAVKLSDVDFAYGNATVLTGFSCEARAGEGLCLFGPSGSGKTTVIRLIAGLEKPLSGTISLNGAVVSGHGVFVPPRNRPVAMVFQDLALWSHLSVSAHLDLVLRGAVTNRRDRNGRVDAVIEACALTNLANRRPGELSGGQQQRLALARALVVDAGILVLDEPFAGLDDELRERFTGLLLDRKRTGTVLIVATHDRAEADALCDATIALTESVR